MPTCSRRTAFVVAILTLAACGRAGTAPAGPPRSSPPPESPPPATADGDSVLFSDDFSGTALDRDHWSVRITGQTVNDEQQAYVDSDSTLYIAHGADAEGAEDGAALVLQPRYEPGFTTPQGNHFDFVSARIDTRDKFEFEHGIAAARMKLPAGAGLWPAFWILGLGDWPATGEIDVMENVGDSSWVSSAMHGPGYSGDTPIVQRYAFADSDATAWHVYSVDWGPQELVFRVDGKATYTVTRSMVTRYGPWAFDNSKYLILNLALGGGYPGAVNGVTQPYHGLPASTVQRIRDDRVRVLVDWVRVTRH
ncbi:MAG TPA: glycoside hydrolase family 16 protein [Longimicrobiaceae bacterium]|nr:glycoside hydrolase family 16 protein [Longimicrobiaceae bacterium]